MEELSVTKSHLSESKATAAARFCREDCLQVKGFTICRSQRLISPFTYTIKCGIKGS